ncbi:MAG: hypothetical protein AB7T49_11690 [Oligoflexales bacterium]
MEKPASRRKLRNLLLQPLLQIKLGLYSIALAIFFSFLVTGLLYLNLFRFYSLVVELTDLGEEVNSILRDYLTQSTYWLMLCAFIYILLNIAVSIIFTHRLVGPTYAFRRHIQNLKKGDYNSRINLRRGDAFAEVADELNDLALQLKNRGTKS